VWTYPHRGDAMIELFIVLLNFSSINWIFVTLAVDAVSILLMLFVQCMSFIISL